MGIKLATITEWASALAASYKIPFTTGSLTRLVRMDTLADWIVKTYAAFVQSGTGAVSEPVQTALRRFVWVEQFGAVGNGSTDDSAAIQAAINAMSAGSELRFMNKSYRIASDVTLPQVNYAVLRGESRTGTIISCAPGVSVKSVGTSIVTGLQMYDLSIEATPTSASIGLDLNESDRGLFHNLRVLGFSTGVRVRAQSYGAYHNTFINPRITGNTTGMLLNGALGANQTHIYGGEISSNTTGLNAATPTNGCTVNGTSFESNTLAISWDGTNSSVMDVRFEGNTNDTSFGANSLYNVLRTGFFDYTKHADASTANSNYVELHGFVTSTTEAKELIETMDPKLASASMVCESANRAYLVVIVPKRLFRASTIYICPTVQSGNVDVGIGPFGGSITASSGSTAVGVINTVQSLALTTPIWLEPGRRYNLVVAFDNNTAGVLGSTLSSAQQVAARKDSWAGVLDTMFPLSGKGLSGLGTAIRLPWIRVL